MSSTTTTTTVKSKERSSSAGQKFWPLKKFGLHGGKTEEQPIALSTKNSIAIEPVKESIEKDVQQKKSKNKRLSSLLSSRRQEASIQNLQSHVNTPESIAADNSKRQQSNNVSNTPTLTRKMGRDITRARINSQNTTITNVPNKQNNMTAKSAGSGTLSRSNTFNSAIFAAASAAATTTTTQQQQTNNNNKTLTRTRELRNNSIRRTSEDNRLLKRPQSPPKRNESPIQPNIMLESVQQQIQLELLMNMNDDVDNDSAIEEDDYEDDHHQQQSSSIKKASNHNKSIHHLIEFDSSPAPVIKSNKKKSLPDNTTLLAELKHDTKEDQEEEEEEEEEDEDEYVLLVEEQEEKKEEEEEDSIHDRKHQHQHSLQSPPPPPVTSDIVASLPEFTRDNSTLDTRSAASAGMVNSNDPVSSTTSALDVQSVYHNTTHQQQPSNLFIPQQPIQRIHRLRPAASFATLRQLASSNNNYQLQQQQQQQQHYQQQQQQLFSNTQHIPHMKRRPVSYIESSHNSNHNYAQYNNTATPAAAAFTAFHGTTTTAAAAATAATLTEEYLSVNRPNYYRRASSEDNRHFHIRQLSDTSTTTMPIQYTPTHVTNTRRLVRSNTVHNLIIKDGNGHRIVQCVGLDEQQQQPVLRRKNSSFESNDSSYQDWSPPTEMMEDTFMSSRQQQLEEQHHQQQLLLIQQQEDHSSSDSSSQHRRIKRKDSAKSISSLCSSSPPSITSYDLKFEKLKSKLEKERATVKALQKQKEAYNKDVLFLSKNVDDLSAENVEWKKKFENEKMLKERFQDDLSSTMDKLNEATEQIRQLETQTRLLKSEIDDKNKEIRDLEKKKHPITRGKSPTTDAKSTDRLLAAQLHHSQNQVRLLKSTMEQFLRMGVFNDDLNSCGPNMTSPTISIDQVVSEFKRGRSKQPRRAGNKSSTTNTDDPPIDNSTVPASRSRKSLVPTEIVDITKQSKTPEKKSLPEENTEELDAQLRELLREKELLQAEYSKAPSSGGNALVRRRREELESRLDTVDSHMCRIKLKMRSRNIL